MSSASPQKLRPVLDGYVTPILKDAGFARRDRTYVRQGTELAWMVDVERSIYVVGPDTEFTLSCGIYVPGMMRFYAGIKEPTAIGASVCCLNARLGMLSDAHLDTWWRLTEQPDPAVEADIGMDIQRRLIADGLPFLERFRTRRDVLEFLLGERHPKDKYVWPHGDRTRLIYAAILTHLMGDTTQSEMLLDAASAQETKSKLEPIVPLIRSRIRDAGS